MKDVEQHVNGFGAISRRQSSCKPMIAAVNGGAYGGGTEMVLNCDIVIASDEAVFATPEVKRGVVAIMGGPLLHLSMFHANLDAAGSHSNTKTSTSCGSSACI